MGLETTIAVAHSAGPSHEKLLRLVTRLLPPQSKTSEQVVEKGRHDRKRRVRYLLKDHNGDFRRKKYIRTDLSPDINCNISIDRTDRTDALCSPSSGIADSSDIMLHRVHRRSEMDPRIDSQLHDNVPTSLSRWCSLPGIVASKVFNLLEAKDASLARLVCRNWALSIMDHREEIQISLPVDLLPNGALSQLPALSRLRLHVLTSQHDSGLCNVTSQMASVAAFLDFAGQHAHVELDLSCTGWHLSLCSLQSFVNTQSMVSVTQLCLRGCSFDQKSSVAGLASLRNLISLDISYCSGAEPSLLANLAQSVPWLEELDWSGNRWCNGCIAPSQDELRSFAGSLRRLKLSNCSINDEALAPLRVLTCLELLDISILPTTGLPASQNLVHNSSHNLEFLNGSGLQHLSGLANLSVLHLQNQIEIPCDSLLWLRYIPKLTTLDLSGCVSLMDDGDLSALKHLVHLECLILDTTNSNLMSPTPIDILKPIQELKSLTSVDISGNWESMPLQALFPLAMLPKLNSLALQKGPVGHTMTLNAYGHSLACTATVLPAVIQRLMGIMTPHSLQQLVLQ